MIKSFVNRFEDPDRPLLGPNVKILKFGGLIFPENILTKYLLFLVHYSVFAFVVAQIVDIYFQRSNIEMVLRNLKITMLSIVNGSKVFTFFKYQDDWLNIINFVTRRDKERRDQNHPEIKKIVKKYTKYCRLMTFSFMYFLALTAILVCMQPMMVYFSPTFRFNIKNGTETRPHMVELWVPFDTDALGGYIVSLSMQVFASAVAALWITMFDTTALSIIVFMEAELKMLKIKARSIFGSKKKPATLEEAKERMKKCHRMHLELSQICNLFNSFLSPIMLLYTIVCSIMLCATGYQIHKETSAFQKIMSAQYLLFGIVQLFMFCWHSSCMIHSSMDLIMGPYDSVWWRRTVEEQRDLLTIVHQYRKPLAIHAGPIVDLTVLTFISIIKGAYSFYTLLREKN